MPEVGELDLTARIEEILNRHAAVGLAVGVVRHGRLEFFHGHGAADIASNTPITKDTVFRIASITKTFTAVAVMQLCEQGRIDLDAPARDYLRAYQLLPAKASFRPATVRDLLTHTAGVPQMPRPGRALTRLLAGAGLTESGDSYDLGQQLPTLAEYYRGGLRLVAEPGTRFTYGNHGFATLGQIVEDVSGQPLDRYFRERIFDPLGMADSDLLRSERVKARLATGYKLGSHGAVPVTDRQPVTAGAGSLYSTPNDMARYVAALAGGGANEHGRVLGPAALAAMFQPQYQTDPRVPGIGLGFMRSYLGAHLAVEHQGILPGFNSQIWVAPDDGTGVMAFTNGASGAMIWLTAEVAGLLRELLGVPDDVIRTDVPHHPEIWGDLCGWYPVSAQLTDNQARGVAGLGAEVFVRRGQLTLRALSPVPAAYRGFALHPDDPKDPCVFRIDLSQFGLGTPRIVFSRELAGAIRSGQASSREVIEAHLRRIEAVNPSVNAITSLLAEQALEAAAAADRRAAGGGARPPLHGVPFTVKENIDLAGAPTTHGLKALAGAYPSRDAPAVGWLKTAGAIPLGHTNCPTLAVRWHTDSELWGATINPWDRSRTPGASSGGEAVALATGMSPLGLGNDGLGSLRWPAQCCGISVLKPTLGRIPAATTIEPVDTPIGVQLTAVQGPMARRVADLRAAFELLAGPTWRDPWTVPAPLRGPEPGRPVRVALVPDPAGRGTARQVQDGVRKAAGALADAGYAVEEAEPPSLERAAQTLLDMLNTPDIRALWRRTSSLLPADTQRFFAEFYQVAGDPDPVATSRRS